MMIFESKRHTQASQTDFSYESAISQRDAPELCTKPFASKNEGVGPQPRVRNKKAHEHSHHRSTGFTRHSRTQWF